MLIDCILLPLLCIKKRTTKILTENGELIKESNCIYLVTKQESCIVIIQIVYMQGNTPLHL